jgi:Tol biopolymer transport system component/DNA-binding winged helix-turn-helix (wHTH) protein
MMIDNRRSSAMTEKIQLAREHDFLLGSLKVSPSTRQLISEQGAELVEPRVMQVLVCLTRANGAVVSRDELISACWNGQIVGDDAINRCISRLRKYASKYGLPPFTIDTIPRVGYKLTTNDISTPSRAGVGSTIVRFGRIQTLAHMIYGRKVTKFALALLATTLFVVATTWGLRPAKRWTVIENRPFLATSQLEAQPAISPDGLMIAYTAGNDAFPSRIYVRRLDRALQTAISPRGYDAESPSWSKDGKRIAFATFRAGEQCRILIAHLSQRKLDAVGHCANRQHTSLSWDRKSELIYYVDRTYTDGPDTIVSLNTLTRATFPITKPSRDIPGDHAPSVSRNGRYLAYVRQFGSTNAEVRIRNVSTGREKTLGAVRGLRSITWTWDSGTVLASVSDGIGSEILALPLSGEKRYQIYASSQLINRLASGPKGILAADIEANRQGLALGTQVPDRKMHFLYPSNGSTYSPAYSINGTLAFISNRAGLNAIWTVSPSSSPKQVFDGGTAFLDRLIWSPDGEQLAFVSSEKGALSINVISRAGKRIFVRPSQSIGYGMPTWAPDGRTLILAGRLKMREKDLHTTNATIRVTAAPPRWQSVAAFHRRLYAVRSGARGIWRIDRVVRRITKNYPRNRIPQLVFFQDSVLIPDFDAVVPGILAQPLSGSITKHFSYTPGASSDASFAVDPHTGTIVYVTDVVRNATINLMRLQLRTQ